MIPPYRTPDPIVLERPVRPPAIADVETAIPAFIGYTQRARRRRANDLILVPTRVGSLAEYEQLFGSARPDRIAVTVTRTADGALALGRLAISGVPESDVTLPDYLLHHSVRSFFDNGGRECVIVAVGRYRPTAAISLRGGSEAAPIPTRFGLQDGLDVAGGADEPTLIVIPEAVKLSPTEYSTLAGAALQQCGTRRDRFAILDLYHGSRDLGFGSGGPAPSLAAARALLGEDHLCCGAAYYPFVRTTYPYPLAPTESNVSVSYPGGRGRLDALRATEPDIYHFVKARLGERTLTLPASGAVAGIYAATDSTRGVWKAPSGVRLFGVAAPVVAVDEPRQDALASDAVGGKSINAVRAFPGRGTLVWGARTLAGNDNEWRYVPVRRFCTVVEQSIRGSVGWVTTEPNEAATWSRLRGAVEDYLMQKWRRAALAGATPTQAFFVRCGLGTTMTANDIARGRIIVQVGLAVVRPAEFVVIRIEVPARARVHGA
jgi:uncharacterized protein